MRRYSDKKPVKRELKKLKKKNFEPIIDLTESVEQRYKDWKVQNMGISLDTFKQIDSSMMNLDKSNPIKYMSKENEDLLDSICD